MVTKIKDDLLNATDEDILHTSNKYVEKKLKIDHRQISDCLNERQKTCHGYIWKYKEEEL